MNNAATKSSYTIREAAELTGLPASTLRYYESIGIIGGIDRGETSGHRVYSDADLNRLTSLACLSATGMSVSDMKQYVANSAVGPSTASEQIDLLTAQQAHLASEAERLAVRRRYVAIKIDYWHAIAAGDEERAELLAGEARALADQLKPARR